MTIRSMTVFVFLAGMLMATNGWSHCQLPCGIYDDEARLQEISENVDTIEKAVKTITELQNEKDTNYNQLVRWVMNKEEHAGKIQEIANQYFLAQRIKFDDAKYAEKLEALHHLIVYAMKCKQTVDQQMVDKLREACRTFEKLYLGEK